MFEPEVVESTATYSETGFLLDLPLFFFSIIVYYSSSDDCVSSFLFLLFVEKNISGFEFMVNG